MLFLICVSLLSHLLCMQECSVTYDRVCVGVCVLIPLIIEEDSLMKSTVLLFSSLQGSCRSPVKPVYRRESFRFFVHCIKS